MRDQRQHEDPGRTPGPVGASGESRVSDLSAPRNRSILAVKPPNVFRDGPETWKSISVKGRADPTAYIKFLVQFHLSRLLCFTLPREHELVNTAAGFLAKEYAEIGVKSLPPVHGPFHAHERNTGGFCLVTSRSFAILSPTTRDMLLDLAEGFSREGMFDRKKAGEMIDLMNLAHEITHAVRFMKTETGVISRAATTSRWQPGGYTFQAFEEGACCMNEEAIARSRGWRRTTQHIRCTLTTERNIGRRMHDVFGWIYGKDDCKLMEQGRWPFRNVKLRIPSERILFVKDGTAVELGYDHIVRCLEKLVENASRDRSLYKLQEFKDDLRRAHVTGETEPLVDFITSAYGESARKFLALCPPQGKVFSMLMTAFGDASLLPPRYRNGIYDELLDILLLMNERESVKSAHGILSRFWKWFLEN